MEYGPRALGARSIFADPRHIEMQESLNLKIKFRESFRPFAPIIMEERIAEYFDIECPSPYMLLVASIVDRLREGESDLVGEDDLLNRLKKKRSNIPAVTHVDYSARIQSVTYEHHPKIHVILSEFENRTGCPVLVNTSFNVRGEPIVCTPSDAYQCFMRTGIDVLVLENYVLEKNMQPEWIDKSDWRIDYVLD